MELEKFDRLLKIRVVVSLATFVVFVGISLHAAIFGWLTDNPTPSVVALLVAYFLWPRRALPKSWKPESDADRARAKTRRELEPRLRKVQLYYFFIAVFLMAFLPFLLGEPVFRMS